MNECKQEKNTIQERIKNIKIDIPGELCRVGYFVAGCVIGCVTTKSILHANLYGNMNALYKEVPELETMMQTAYEALKAKNK